MPDKMDLPPLLKEFYPSRWDKKEEEEKIKACQNLENYLAAESERKPYKVKNYDRATNFFIGLTDLYWLGRTDPVEKTIEVKVQGSNSSFEALRSLTHESARADQYQLVELMEKASSGRQFEPEYKEALKRKEISKTDMTVIKWELNHPLNPNRGAQFYEQQLIALDARQRSLKFLTRNYTFMGDEQAQYDHPQRVGLAKTSFKEYLDVIGDSELERGKELVTTIGEQEDWLQYKKSSGMFSDYSLYPAEQNRICDKYLNGRCSMSDFKVFNKIKSWEAEKRICLEEAEKAVENSNRVTLEELEGAQQKKKVNSTHGMTMAAPEKIRGCKIL